MKDRASPGGQRRLAVSDWLLVSVAGVLLVTFLDAALLQRKRGYFTGGFLSAEHATKLADVVGFFSGSLVADVAVVVPIAAFGLWLSARFKLHRASSRLLALALSVGPLVVVDFISYKLSDYLGDAFDLSLMFDLTGRHPSELLAVSFDHLLTMAFVIAGGICAALAGLWVLQRSTSEPTRTSARRTLPNRQLVVAALTPLLIGLVTTSILRSRSEVLDYGLRRKPSAQALGWLVTRLTDFDRDGYGLLSAPPDPDPWNRHVHPYALDVPGNGLDEDGVGGDLPAGPAYAEPVLGPGRWPHTPNVVLVVLESFRADAVGATLQGKPVTPVLARLAARGVSSSYAYSLNGYTVQSRHHLFSGSLANLLDRTSLVDDFKANGYQVAYFSAQDESFGRDDMSVGFDRADVAYDARSDRTERYSTFATPGSLAVPYTVLLRRVDEFLEKRDRTQPLFLYVNFHDTHFPYHHKAIQPLIDPTVLRQSEIQPGRMAELKRMYLNTAANVDRGIGELLDEARRSLGEEPAVIVTADHGESLFDEGFLGHGYALNDAQTHIPLIAVNLPIVIEEPFSQTDLRGALRHALGEAAIESHPLLRDKPSGTVFQYLGTLERPRQVGFRTKHGQVIYDFRTGKVWTDNGAWQRPRDLTDAGSRAYLALVQFWERVRLAQRAVKKRHG